MTCTDCLGTGMKVSEYTYGDGSKGTYPMECPTCSGTGETE